MQIEELEKENSYLEYLLIRQLKRKKKKRSTQNEPTFYVVTEMKGSQIRARRIILKGR